MRLGDALASRLDTASGQELDVIGDMIGVRRNDAETDIAHRERIRPALVAWRSNDRCAYCGLSDHAHHCARQCGRAVNGDDVC
jgi:hypothetical protein